jgi:hypothetical protein
VETRFEPPLYTGSSAGVTINAQDGWATPAGFGPFKVYTYGANIYTLPQCPGGVAQFAAGAFTALPARATHPSNFVAADLWTATWDVAATLEAPPPTAAQLGSIALEDSSLARSFVAMYQWPDPATALVFDAPYAVFDAAGAAQPQQVPGPPWQGLQRSHWYRQTTTWRFSTNQILEVTITDLTTGAIAIVNPTGWYLRGGAAPANPIPTGVSLNAIGAPANVLAIDNLMVSPQVQVAAVVPPSGGYGDIVTIQGSGFGISVDDLEVGYLDGDGVRVHPLTVLAVGPSQITARVEALPNDSTPGPIIVRRGQGTRGTMVPLLRDIIPEDPQGIWGWQRRSDPRVGAGPGPFAPIIHPSPPGFRWFFGTLEAGRMAVVISGDRQPNTTLLLQARTEATALRMASSLAESSVRLRLTGDAQSTAVRLAEALRAGFSRDGVVTNTQITNVGLNTWKISLEQRDPLNNPIPVDRGTLDLTLIDPIEVNPFAIGGVTAFYAANLAVIGGPEAQVTVGSSGADGATITPNTPAIGGIRVYMDPVDLTAANNSFSVTGWGVVSAVPDQLVGSAALHSTGGQCDLVSTFAPIGAANITVEVYDNTLLVGSATVPAGTVGQIGYLSGAPSVVGCGQLVNGGAGVWLTLDRLCAITPTGGTPLLGNQVILRAAGATGVLQSLQAFDTAAGLAARAANVNIKAPVEGGICYANCDESATPPVLNVGDFTCFLQQFAAGAETANCDGSTTPPVLNVADFTCFLQKYAAGCP